MPTIRNISPDELRVPVLRAVVPPDGVVDVPDDLLDGFKDQTKTWEVTAPAKRAAKDDKE